MGLISKLATRKAAAPQRIPIVAPAGWSTGDASRVAAVVRAVGCTIGQQQLTSAGFVGTDVLGLANTLHSSPSTVWVLRSGLREWGIAIGKYTSSGIVLDWAVGLEFDGGELPTAAMLTTPRQLTSDGALMNREAHDEVRSLLTRSLGFRAVPQGTAESRIAAASLPAPAGNPVPQQLSHLRFLTPLEVSAVDEAIGAMPFRCIHHVPPTLRRWGLRTSSSGPRPVCTSTVEDLGDIREVRLVVELSEAEGVTQALNSERASTLIRSLFRSVFSAGGEPRWPRDGE